MTLTTPPNDLSTLDQPQPESASYTRRILLIAAYIVLMLLLLYALYGSYQQPVSKKKAVQKPWPISQGFLLLLLPPDA